MGTWSPGPRVRSLWGRSPSQLPRSFLWVGFCGSGLRWAPAPRVGTRVGPRTRGRPPVCRVEVGGRPTRDPRSDTEHGRPDVFIGRQGCRTRSDQCLVCSLEPGFSGVACPGLDGAPASSSVASHLHFGPYRVLSVLAPVLPGSHPAPDADTQPPTPLRRPPTCRAERAVYGPVRRGGRSRSAVGGCRKDGKRRERPGGQDVEGVGAGGEEGKGRPLFRLAEGLVGDRSIGQRPRGRRPR